MSPPLCGSEKTTNKWWGHIIDQDISSPSPSLCAAHPNLPELPNWLKPNEVTALPVPIIDMQAIPWLAYLTLAALPVLVAQLHTRPSRFCLYALVRKSNSWVLLRTVHESIVIVQVMPLIYINLFNRTSQLSLRHPIPRGHCHTAISSAAHLNCPFGIQFREVLFVRWYSILYYSTANAMCRRMNIR